MSIIPFDDRDGWIWLDGKMLPWREAKVHVLNHGLHYASSVFEGERAYNGKIFKSRQHSERLIKSADFLGMKIPFTAEQLCAAKEEVRVKNNLKNAYFRPIAWRGSEQMGIYVSGVTTHVAIAAWEWPSYYTDEKYNNGINANIEKHWRKPAPNTAPSQSKAGALYAVNTMVKTNSVQNGYDEAIMIDYRGYLAEASSANIFLVMGDGKIHTPIPDCFLNGITRLTIIDLARELGYEVIERVIMPEELGDAKEVFITGTAAEVTPIGKIDDKTYTVGETTKAIRTAYEKLVRS